MLGSLNPTACVESNTDVIQEHVLVLLWFRLDEEATSSSLNRVNYVYVSASTNRRRGTANGSEGWEL